MIKADKTVSIDVVKETPQNLKNICEEIIWIVDNHDLDSEWQNEVLSRTKEINSAIAKLP